MPTKPHNLKFNRKFANLTEHSQNIIKTEKSYKQLVSTFDSLINRYHKEIMSMSKVNQIFSLLSIIFIHFRLVLLKNQRKE